MRIGSVMNSFISNLQRCSWRLLGLSFKRRHRINRDVRFSKDKTPYKTTFDLHFLEGQIKLKSNPAYLLRLTESELHLGVGAYGFNKAQLQAWRDALIDDAKSKALHRALDQAAKAGFGTLHGQHYKTVPKGYPADHPNAELLKYNMAYLTNVGAPTKALFGPSAVDHCLKAYRALRPMQQWLVDVVGDKA
jgi:uncharacterized protein (TIGR02453 family)